MRVFLSFTVALSACSGPRPEAAPEPGVPSCPPARSEVVTLPCEDEHSQIATTGEQLTLQPTDFASLPGWRDDRLSEAVVAFRASCKVIAELRDGDKLGVSAFAGRARDWRPACRAASELSEGDDDAARGFFEREFKVYEAHGKGGHLAKFSGYYVQPVRGSFERSDRYRFPLLKRPADLVEIQTSDFLPDGRGRRIWGRVVNGRLERYPVRKLIHKRKLVADDVVMWVDDSVDAIFAEIQGSARATMADGSKVLRSSSRRTPS
jgi:membrane-bound lytic murein transglycosylase A